MLTFKNEIELEYASLSIIAVFKDDIARGMRVKRDIKIGDKLFQISVCAYGIPHYIDTYIYLYDETGTREIELCYIKSSGKRPNYENIKRPLIKLFNLIQLNLDSFITYFDKNCVVITEHRLYPGDLLMSNENNVYDLGSYCLAPSDCKYHSIFKNSKVVSDVKGSVVKLSEHPQFETFCSISYPRLGRGSIVGNYYGMNDEQITLLRKGEKLIHHGKEYVIVDKRIHDGELVAEAVINKKINILQTINNVVSEKDMRYIISNIEIDHAWEGLYPENRIGMRRKRF